MENIKTLNTEIEIREFISSHSGEIKGLYHDRYFKMGGWNGIMDALSEVERRYNVEIAMDEIIPQFDKKEIDRLFEKIIEEEL